MMNWEIIIEQHLRSKATQDRAAISPRYFKTGKGEYGEGDYFIGVAVPYQRALANKYALQLTEVDIEQLLQSKYHEVRLTALLMLNKLFVGSKSTNEASRYVKLYLNNLPAVNNWDLVDSTAPILLGGWLEQRDRKMLYQFAKSNNLWKNRIAIITTLAFIRKGDLDDLFRISTILLKHPHDLIHKATGWMLREGWKKDPKRVEKYLQQYAANMPRTMLRYAIEKMTPARRAYFRKLTA